MYFVCSSIFFRYHTRVSNRCCFYVGLWISFSILVSWVLLDLHVISVSMEEMEKQGFSLCSFVGLMCSLNLFPGDSYVNTICLCTPSCMDFSHQFLNIGPGTNKNYYDLFFLHCLGFGTTWIIDKNGLLF
jgi:hypothetical protein